jgi:hypothetical protein
MSFFAIFCREYIFPTMNSEKESYKTFIMLSLVVSLSVTSRSSGEQKHTFTPAPTPPCPRPHATILNWRTMYIHMHMSMPCRSTTIKLITLLFIDSLTPSPLSLYLFGPQPLHTRLTSTPVQYRSRWANVVPKRINKIQLNLTEPAS